MNERGPFRWRCLVMRWDGAEITVYVDACNHLFAERRCGLVVDQLGPLWGQAKFRVTESVGVAPGWRRVRKGWKYEPNAA